ncbi:MAG: MarR family transcriptional regulator [Candidatus Marinimicrobia bacterium]|jgi:DNA-binding MarR family transcriptional regulator|nr:MarR family transcriptional regulator [Candidatus Neomarinimicrobiota bacterium]MDP6592829.1 MarR family transcriptional regulator [Candidatus Neomarinimicrobiota bacterium]MDP6835850.1 MarR family transcriptional regulator [Candidatus Neomarinimicrobiota bacterium]MDP6965829.1 MarR family transcriptional regulator [Candidatus Neomarinimicrobiota bacterium]|tara:strand:+ start:209 stop:634 length:426 start_codon:yes stop_codon:yes gene_type:complete
MEFDELITELTLTLNALHRKQICQEGQTLSQCFILLSIPDGGIDMSTLAQKLGLDNSTVTRLIDNLEKRGVLKRKRSQSDRRVNRVFLTDAGEEVLSQLESRSAALSERIENQLSDEEQEVIRESLEGVLWSLSKELLRLS